MVPHRRRMPVRALDNSIRGAKRESRQISPVVRPGCPPKTLARSSATAASDFAIIDKSIEESHCGPRLHTPSTIFSGHLIPDGPLVCAVARVVFLGGIGWLLFVPLQPQQWVILAALLAGFFLYSGGLYALTFLRPARIRTYYLCVFIVDLLIITALNDYVGEVKGSFYLAYYLLVALHAYYFRLGMGLIVAGLASVLYVMSDYPEFQTIVWHEYTLRIAFLFLVATFLGSWRKKIKATSNTWNASIASCRKRHVNSTRLYPTGGSPTANYSDEKLSSLGTLVAGVAHEINNPIGIIANRVEVLRLEHEEQGLDDALREDLEVIHRQAHRVTEITSAPRLCSAVIA